MGKLHRFETGQGRSPEPEDVAGLPSEKISGPEELSEPEELKVRMAVKNRHI